MSARSRSRRRSSPYPSRCPRRRRPRRSQLAWVAVLGAEAALLAASPTTPAVDPGKPGSGLGIRSHHARWQPRPGVTWQWQLDGRIDPTVRAKVYDIDGFDASSRLVRKLHRLGRRAICYIDAGAYESWRPDAHRFPEVVLGANSEWRNQRWLDIRRLDIIGPIMVARLKMCARKGFDGVELDEIDGYSNDTGFPLSATHQLRYNRFVARAARRLGLAAGMKNDVEQVKALIRYFDFALNEQCFQFRECRSLTPFIRAGKAVFHVEYHVSLSRFCPTTVQLGFSSMRKRLNLRGWRGPCPVTRSTIEPRPTPAAELPRTGGGETGLAGSLWQGVTPIEGCALGCVHRLRPWWVAARPGRRRVSSIRLNLFGTLVDDTLVMGLPLPGFPPLLKLRSSRGRRSSGGSGLSLAIAAATSAVAISAATAMVSVAVTTRVVRAGRALAIATRILR